MPIYEYACERCESEFEVEQRITDNPLKTCPRCRSKKVKRLISRTSFVLKGGGWYSDLYASPGAKSDPSNSGDDKAAGKAESKTEAKPEAKSDGSAKAAEKPSADRKRKGDKAAV